MTNYTQEITKKFYEANPDLLKLEFGADIEVAGVARDNPGCEHDVIIYSTQEREDKGYYRTGYFGEVHKDDIEVNYGKPITVLQAISLFDFHGGIDTDGIVYEKAYDPNTDNHVEDISLDIKLDPTIALFKDLPEGTQEKIYKLVD